MIAKADMRIGHLDDPFVANRHAEDVRSQILQGTEPVAYRLAMHDPVLFPHVGWDISEAVSLAQGIAELGAKDPGEGLRGEEKVLTGR